MKKIYALGIIIIAVGGIIWYFSLSDIEDGGTQHTTPVSKSVEIVDFATTGNVEKYISGYGQVVSVSRVEVTPQTQGVVSRVYKSLGDTVSVGDIVVEINNSGQRQQVANARAGLASAQSRLAQAIATQGDVLENQQSQVTQVDNNISEKEQQIRIANQTLQTDLANILEATINPLFSNHEQINRLFIPPSSSLSRENIVQSDYTTIASLIERYRSQDTLTPDIESLAEVTAYLQQLLDLVFTVEPSVRVTLEDIAGWRNSLVAAKSTIENKISTITALDNAVKNLKESRTVAENTLSQTEQINQKTDVDIARNTVQSASASLDTALLELQRTRVVAPVFGTISNISARVGQSASGGSPLFTVANERALRVDSRISPDIARQIAVGDKVQIDGRYPATISNISPSIDTVTGQVDVEIVLEKSVGQLVSGMGVDLQIIPSQTETEQILSVPISAVFVRDEQSYVYVIENNQAQSRPVVIDNLFGEYVAVQSGITASDSVILYARAIQDQDSVTAIQ